MFLLDRAASLAALPVTAALLACTTSPGFARELARPVITATTLNALTMSAVPDMPDPAVPPSATLNTGAGSAAVAARPALQPAIAQDQASLDTSQQGDEYRTLAAAVAAQDAVQDTDATNRELACLAAGVYFEAKGEPLAGQLAVAQTILNRVNSGRFPRSVCSVLTQRGQFSFVRGGVVPSGAGRSGWTTAVAIAKVAQRALWDGVAADALYFHARHVSPGWRMARVAAIGNHVFYR